jgi:hypothetical protein
MKKSTLLFLTHLCLIAKISSQPANSLNQINGFKEIVLESNIATFSGKISQFGDGYDYIGNCCQTAFNRPVKDIFLKFENEKLFWIKISMAEKYFSLTQAKEFASQIEKEFGPPETAILPGEVLSYSWIGKKAKVVLLIYMLEVNPQSEQPILTSQLEISSINSHSHPTENSALKKKKPDL